MNTDRFKFRVWDKEKKVYVGDDFLMSRNHDVFGWEHHPERFIVEQCTGTKDINGNLIYEGDVIRYDKLYEGYTFVVKWKPDMVMFVLWDINKGGSAILGAGVEQCAKIIGNIHEAKWGIEK